ncbi:MAG: immunoglobulin domain-containing protein, partial [Phycisphaerae bacterium]
MIRRLPAWLLPALAVVMAAPRADAGCVWESGPSFPTLFARSDAAAVNQAGVIVVLGGRPMTNSQSPAHFLDLPAGATTWGSGPLIAPARINPAATVDANGQIIIFGGTTFDDTGGGNGAFQTGVAYDIVLGEGMATAPLASTRTRARFGFATDNLHFFYIVGGRQASATTPQNPNADTIVDFLDRYDPATDTWNSTLSALPAGRTDAAAVYDGLGHILLIGGASDVSGTTQATVFSYDIATDTWTTLANPEPAAMSRQAAVLGGDGLVYVAGGTNGGPTNSASVFIFDPVALTWSTGPSLSVSRRGAAIALANDGYIYVMGGGGNIGTTTVERLFTGSGAADCDMNGVPDVCEVGPEPIIDVHPADTSGCQGGSATLTVTASGAASLTLTYQWQKFNTGTSVWDDLVGQTAAALTINPVGMADAGQFRVVVTNTCGTATSNAAILSVITIAPTITAQPQSQTPCENTSVTFTVTATGDATLRYQWRKDGSPVGTDSPSYTIASVSTTDAGDYDVVVTNACGSATSAIATLTVKTLPTITTHPVGDNVCEGVSVTFTVAASGTAPLSYQWQRFNSVSFIWEDLPGETNTTLVIVSPTLASKGSYRVLVSNLCGMDTSATAFLTVRAAPTPTIVATPGATVCQGTTVMLDAGSGFLSYAWLPGGETTQTIQVTAGGTYSVT